MRSIDFPKLIIPRDFNLLSDKDKVKARHHLPSLLRAFAALVSLVVAVLYSSARVDIIVRLHDTRRSHRGRLIDTHRAVSIARRGSVRLQLIVLVTHEIRLIIHVLLLLRLLLTAGAGGCRCHSHRRNCSRCCVARILLQWFRGVGSHRSSYFRQIVLVFAVHSQKVLLHVVGAIEHLLTDVALERLLLPVDTLVSREEIASVRGVGTESARISLARGCVWWSACRILRHI